MQIQYREIKSQFFRRFFSWAGYPNPVWTKWAKILRCRGRDIPPLWHGLFVLYKINIAIATTNKGVKWSAFVKTTANMESLRHFFFTQKNIVATIAKLRIGPPAQEQESVSQLVS